MNGGDRSKLGGLAWPGVFAVIVTLYAYWSSERDLDSARPAPVAPPPWNLVTTGELFAVHARLWEDPLLVAYEDWDARIARKEVSANGDGSYVVMQGGKAPLSGKDATEAARKHFRSLVTTYPEKTWAKALGDDPASVPTLVLPILMRGGASPEDTDWRRRQQYAVLCGLARCGFKLDFPDRMSYVVIRNFNQYVKARPDLMQSDTSPFDLVVPAKLVTVDESQVRLERNVGKIRVDVDDQNRQRCQVLLLYLNESQLGAQPLPALSGLLEELFGHYSADDDDAKGVWKRLLVRIIGPTSSDGLKGFSTADNIPLLTDLNAGQEQSSRVLQVFSPHATAVATAARDSPAGVQLVRVVGDDNQLVEALHHELDLRNACPINHPEDVADADDSVGTTEHEGPRGGWHIALITEQDTRYGRRIVDVFNRQFGVANVTTFRYLRGIDGRTWRPSDARPDSGKSPSNAVSERGRNDPFVTLPENAEWKWRPEGTSQYDYLLRLREVLDNKDRELQQAGGGGIRAIGIVATDVYDKLLVLRALRSSFPRAVFFTTDLDANLSHVDEYPSTRNLIVASHFGLRLHPDLQLDIPPFRESYQTSTFLATLLALNLKCAELRLNPADPWALSTSTGSNGNASDGEPSANRPRAASFALKPVVFEIGRSGPFQLTLSREMTLLPDKFQQFDANHDQALDEPEFDTMLGEGGLKSIGLAPLDVDQNKQLSFDECLNSSAVRSLGLIHPLSQRETPFPWLVFWGAALLMACLVTFAINGVLALDSMLSGVRRTVDRVDVVFRSLEQRLRRRNENVAAMNLEAAAIAVRKWLLSPTMVPFWSTMVAALVIRLLAWLAAHVPDWEPLDLAYAVSIWPTMMIEAALICLCASLLYSWWLQGSPRAGAPAADDLVGSHELPLEFRPEVFSSIKLRSRIGVVFGIVLVMLLFESWMYTVSPVRGLLARLIDVTLIFLTNLSVVLVVVSVIAYLERCRQLAHCAGEEARGDGHYLRAVRLIASQTDATKWRVPLAVTALIGLALSYHPRLDYRPLPYGTLLGGCLGFGALLLWAFLLRRDAQHVRSEGINHLKLERLELLGYEGDAGASAESTDHDAPADQVVADPAAIDRDGGGGLATAVKPPLRSIREPSSSADRKIKLIDEEIRHIESIETGAYRNLLSGPTMAWLTGSAGAWFGIDWLLNMLQTGI